MHYSLFSHVKIPLPSANTHIFPINPYLGLRILTDTLRHAELGPKREIEILALSITLQHDILAKGVVLVLEQLQGVSAFFIFLIQGQWCFPHELIVYQHIHSFRLGRNADIGKIRF